MSDDLIDEAIERLAFAAMNARSARRRVTGESSHHPLPPIDAVLAEIDRAHEALLAHQAKVAADARCVCCTYDCGDRRGHIKVDDVISTRAGGIPYERCNCGQAWPCPNAPTT